MSCTHPFTQYDCDVLFCSDCGERLNLVEFKISIDDGYCEWQYPIKLSDEFSVNKVMQKICETFKVEMLEGKFLRMTLKDNDDDLD